MNVRAFILLSLAGALALGGEASAQTRRRQPYDVPNLVPSYDPYAMKEDQPWLPKKTDPYAIRQDPYPYSTPQSQARAAKQVRDYEQAKGAVAYTPPKPPEVAMPRSGRGQSCNRLFVDC